MTTTTPTDFQRTIHTAKHSPPPKGLDALSYRLIGNWRRAPWRNRQLSASAKRIDQIRLDLTELNDSQLAQKLTELHRSRRRNSEAGKDSLLEKGLAILAVAAHRELRLIPYQVQLMAAAALCRGHLTEVDTGEGKTLAIALAAAYQAMSGKPCHVITANEYLANRDATYLKSFYRRAGLTVGCVAGGISDPERRKAYRCNVTYTTAKEVSADFLRDRLRLQGMENSGPRLGLAKTIHPQNSSLDPVQRGLFYCLIDEADNALIDEAVTPLIISMTQEAGELESACSAAWEFAGGIKRAVDYEVNLSKKIIVIDSKHLHEIASQWELTGSKLWTSNRRRAELLRLALEAREFFHRDQQYVIDDNKVVIIDETTGRPMPMRTWKEGLHQMIEAKEQVPMTGASETMARMSFQSFFKKYQHLAGASGTVREVAAEVWQTYELPVIRIPRNLPNQRKFSGRKFYRTGREKFDAIVAEVLLRHSLEQPVLVGARSIDVSEKIAEQLVAAGVVCYVLNAKKHREEASLVKLAGNRSRITIATNMAGRGTDIELAPGVDELGGLHVIASEPHESARVDRQLFGRSARQGQPGTVAVIYSAEDPLFVRFLSSPVRKLWSLSLRPKKGPVRWAAEKWGFILLILAQKRAQAQARRRRRQVMKTEIDLRARLGFAKGMKKRVL